MVDGVRTRAARAGRAARAASCPRCLRRSRSSTSREAQSTARGGDRRGASSASPTSPLRTSAGSATGPSGSTASDFLFVDGFPMVKRPFYTHPDPAPARVLEQLRPALPRARAGHRRPAAAPLRGLPRGAREPRRSARAVRRRIWRRSGYGMPPHGGFAIGLERFVARLARGGEHPRDDALPARPHEARAVSFAPTGAAADASACHSPTGAREAAGGERGGEEPRILGRPSAHVLERQSRAGLLPARDVDLVDAIAPLGRLEPARPGDPHLAEASARAERVWWETPRCRSRSSRSDTRGARIGRRRARSRHSPPRPPPAPP